MPLTNSAFVGWVYDLRMAQGTKCLHAICDYMRKVTLKFQHEMSIITGYM